MATVVNTQSPWQSLGASLGSMGSGYVQQQNLNRQMQQNQQQMGIMEQRNKMFGQQNQLGQDRLAFEQRKYEEGKTAATEADKQAAYKKAMEWTEEFFAAEPNSPKRQFMASVGNMPIKQLFPDIDLNTYVGAERVPSRKEQADAAKALLNSDSPDAQQLGAQRLTDLYNNPNQTMDDPDVNQAILGRKGTPGQNLAQNMRNEELKKKQGEADEKTWTSNIKMAEKTTKSMLGKRTDDLQGHIKKLRTTIIDDMHNTIRPVSGESVEDAAARAGMSKVTRMTYPEIFDDKGYSFLDTLNPSRKALEKGEGYVRAGDLQQYKDLKKYEAWARMVNVMLPEAVSEGKKRFPLTFFNRTDWSSPPKGFNPDKMYSTEEMLDLINKKAKSKLNVFSHMKQTNDMIEKFMKEQCAPQDKDEMRKLFREAKKKNIPIETIIQKYVGG